MTRIVPASLAAVPLLFVASGCVSADSVSVRAGDVRLEGHDATVAPGFTVPDTEDLWRPTGGAMLRTRLGPATIERTREGAMFVVFPGGRRGEIVVGVEDAGITRPTPAPFARRPAGRAERDAFAALGALIEFISAPYAALPSSLEAWLQGPDEELRSAAAGLTRHLLDADRAAFRGTIGRKGVVNGWVAPTPAARERLTQALRAVGRAKP